MTVAQLLLGNSYTLGCRAELTLYAVRIAVPACREPLAKVVKPRIFLGDALVECVDGLLKFDQAVLGLALALSRFPGGFVALVYFLSLLAVTPFDLLEIVDGLLRKGKP